MWCGGERNTLHSLEVSVTPCIHCTANGGKEPRSKKTGKVRKLGGLGHNLGSETKKNQFSSVA